MKLSADEVADRLADCQGWSADGDSITRTFVLPTFADAIAFVTRLAFDAEAADHHPGLQVNYRKVVVTWSTHSEGGLTEKDFDGARQSDMIAARFS